MTEDCPLAGRASFRAALALGLLEEMMARWGQDIAFQEPPFPAAYPSRFHTLDGGDEWSQVVVCLETHQAT